MLDFAFNTGHQNADVVIFGDSSAFIGIDPRVVNAQLGVKSIVLPGTIGSLPVTDDLALRRYLSSNKPPRLIVLYFSAWNLDYRNVDNIRPFEGDEMMLRHGSWIEIARFARRNTFDALVFPFRLYSTFGPGMLHAILRHEDRESATAMALGHVDDHDPFPTLTEGCRLPALMTTPGKQTTVESLIRVYTTPATQVMVYLAPVPGCQNAILLSSRSYSSLNAAPPLVLPARDFLGDPNFAHLLPIFVGPSSRQFAKSLQARLEHLAVDHQIPAAPLSPQEGSR